MSATALILALLLSGQPGPQTPNAEGLVTGPDGQPCAPSMQVCAYDLDPRTHRPMTYPADVVRYQEAVEGCIHWGGEVGDNMPARARQIERGQHQTCDVARPLGRRLARRYARNAPVLRRVRAIQALARSIDL